MGTKKLPCTLNSVELQDIAQSKLYAVIGAGLFFFCFLQELYNNFCWLVTCGVVSAGIGAVP